MMTQKGHRLDNSVHRDKRKAAADFIVEYLIHKGITDVFGYPGGMVTYLMDSFSRHSDCISAHVTYHEQGAAFAACGYAQASGKAGVAYATSGPGATNLITGICNAYFDSIPTLFITGQVNANEAKGGYGVRQRGFQETDIVSMVKPVTKYAVYVEKVGSLPGELEKAYSMATTGRKGPVLLDIPMNVFREQVEVSGATAQEQEAPRDIADVVESASAAVRHSVSPVLLIGAGVKAAGCEEGVRKAAKRLGIPVVSSMIAFDVMQDDPHYYGFIGAYGTRAANFIAAKSDLVISVGSRMDIRQVGFHREGFAPDAKIIRFDVDPGELDYPVHANEAQFCMDMESTVRVLEALEGGRDYGAWISVCDEIRRLLSAIDKDSAGRMMESVGEGIPEDAVITTDVGQNQVWVAQALKVKSGQKVLFSGGHGAMGYSLPAAIGACYGSGKKPVYCITGDGGLQMNIQELQFIAREHLPIKIVVLNNNALGMIRHFQEMYFDGRYFQTRPEGGYVAPDFARIAEAYGIRSKRVEADRMEGYALTDDAPELLEVLIHGDTYVLPKLEFGKPNQDQEPLIDRDLYERIMKMQPGA
ncbi:thiamine pyrophosphate-binding protein [uncultured Acetatifactor sp.]|uniref:thiamine pyrophosphate-binding protein n=1 Tax=uncultured Acetatifactor sp. TaxID=1671927 RepID=UPI002629549D|nr:thiamine pyrophosphate-binding protein [uncultured Acetatifactor sp.]